jgi:gamma-glutamyltranspeptidase/glutathione hydrolase
MQKLTRFFAWSLSLLLVVVAAAIVAGLGFRLAVGPVREDMPHRVVYAPNEVVVTSQPLASQAGLEVLRKGGNAVDAAVTAAAVLSVIEPYMTGIGGDMFAILWSAQEQSLIGVNGSGRSGSRMTTDAERSEVGVRSVTIPGALSGWAALLETYGTITLAEALAPAIELAEEGFPVSDVTASEWAVFSDVLRYNPTARATFLIDGERAPEAGEWFSNPAYAETLRMIAREGPHVLYGGELGQRIAAELQQYGGGYLTLEDFRDHRAEWVEPLSVPFGEYRLWELPPNGQGIAALEMLRILEAYDLAAMGHNSATYLHHLIEAKKLAFADLETFVGDPEFMTVSPEQLLADDFIEQRRSLIQRGRALTQAQPDSSLTTTETTYFAVADRAGNMISFINSLADGFGSGVVVTDTGFALQNRAIGFAETPDRANSPGPRRLPFHTIIPGFVTKAGDDGTQQPWLAFGIVGGDQQPQAQVQVLLNMLVFGMDVQEALDAPRFRHWRGNTVSFETAIPSTVVDQLASMGHAPQNSLAEMTEIISLGQNRGLLFGGGQGILRVQRGYTAGSDSRRDGLAAAH